MNYLAAAIDKLKPNSEYTFTNLDYATIKWIKLHGDAPTQAEIDATIEEIKTKQTQDLIDLENAKVTAQAKLQALGLTTEDLKALGL